MDNLRILTTLRKSACAVAARRRRTSDTAEHGACRVRPPRYPPGRQPRGRPRNRESGPSGGYAPTAAGRAGAAAGPTGARDRMACRGPTISYMEGPRLIVPQRPRSAASDTPRAVPLLRRTAHGARPRALGPTHFRRPSGPGHIPASPAVRAAAQARGRSAGSGAAAPGRPQARAVAPAGRSPAVVRPAPHSREPSCRGPYSQGPHSSRAVLRGTLLPGRIPHGTRPQRQAGLLVQDREIASGASSAFQTD